MTHVDLIEKLQEYNPMASSPQQHHILVVPDPSVEGALIKLKGSRTSDPCTFCNDTHTFISLPGQTHMAKNRWPSVTLYFVSWAGRKTTLRQCRSRSPQDGLDWSVHPENCADSQSRYYGSGLGVKTWGACGGRRKKYALEENMGISLIYLLSASFTNIFIQQQQEPPKYFQKRERWRSLRIFESRHSNPRFNPNAILQKKQLVSSSNPSAFRVHAYQCPPPEEEMARWANMHRTRQLLTIGGGERDGDGEADELGERHEGVSPVPRRFGDGRLLVSDTCPGSLWSLQKRGDTSSEVASASPNEGKISQPAWAAPAWMPMSLRVAWHEHAGPTDKVDVLT